MTVFFYWIESSESFDKVLLETSAKLVAVDEKYSSETIFFIILELSLVSQPSCLVQLTEVFVVNWAGYMTRFLIVKYSKAAEAIVAPCSWVAKLTLRVVEHTAALEFTLLVELTFVSGSVSKSMLSVSFYFWKLTRRSIVFNYALKCLNRCALLESQLLIHSINWSLKIFRMIYFMYIGVSWCLF